MKHIKVYNNYVSERLSPRTYIDAADRLKYLKHLTRSADLVNHFFDKNKDNNFYLNTDGNPRKCYLESITLSVPIEWSGDDDKKVFKELFKYSAIDNKYHDLYPKYDVYDSVTDWVTYNEESPNYCSYKVMITFKFVDITNMGGKHDSQYELILPNNIYISDVNSEINIRQSALYIPRLGRGRYNYSFDDRKSAMLFKKYYLDFLNESKDFFKKIMDNSVFLEYSWDEIISSIKNYSVNNFYNTHGKCSFEIDIDAL